LVQHEIGTLIQRTILAEGIACDLLHGERIASFDWSGENRAGKGKGRSELDERWHIGGVCKDGTEKKQIWSEGLLRTTRVRTAGG
jgi:hypothetical protein